ncbi:MAG TPA: hypothetical protein VMW43_06670 [Bacteroidota bacterium]|nr:hypothetical protein [Bacteroidota bacterium]
MHRQSYSLLLALASLWICGSAIGSAQNLYDTAASASPLPAPFQAGHDSASASFHVVTDRSCERSFVWRDSQSTAGDPPSNSLDVWDNRTMKRVSSIPPPASRLSWSAEFTPDHDHVIFYPYGGGKTYIWSVSANTIDSVRIKTSGYRVAFHAASHDGQMLLVAPAISAYPQALACFSISGNKWIWWLTDLQNLRAAAFTGNDSDIIAFGEDDVYRINSRTGKIRSRMKNILRGYEIDATRLAISPGGTRFAIWRGRRSDSILEPLLTLLLVWNPHMEVWDIGQHDVIASFGMPKWGFDGCGFTMDENYLVAHRGDRIYRLTIADETEARLDAQGTPDDLKETDHYSIGCTSHDGTSSVTVIQALRSTVQNPKHVRLCSFTGRRWDTAIPEGGQAIGVSYSPGEQEIILVCKECIYALDAGSGTIARQNRAPWLVNH